MIVGRNPMNDVRVLLIDAGETPALCQTVNRGRLEQFLFTQTATLSGGMDAMRKSRFHLVLVNLSVPNALASESVTQILRIAPDVPVIALVNEGEVTKAGMALRHGMDDYILKGCTCDYLVRVLRHAIERKSLTARREKARSNAAAKDHRLTAHLSHECRNALACIHQFGTILIDGLAGNVSEEQREYLCIMLENTSRIRDVLDNALEGSPMLEAAMNSNPAHLEDGPNG
jgi:DNA-binding NtrC family response regulator